MGQAENIKTKTIQWLLDGSLNFDRTKDVIATEPLFSINRRKADLLILSKDIHTIEIKSDADNTNKLKNQLIDYHKTSDKVSVITTKKHLRKVKNIIRTNTGLILFDSEKFTIIQAPKKNKRLDKNSLLMFLPKDELLKIYKKNDKWSLSTDEIRKKLTNTLTVKTLDHLVYLFLKQRYGKIFKIFLNDTNGNFVWDELRGLCGKFDRLY